MAFAYPYQPNFFGAPYGYQMPQQMAPAPVQRQPAAVQQPPMPQPVQQAIQQGFVLVQSEQEARAYPVAPGNSITFKDETAPFCYVKTMGFNQLDRPTFERYRLVKEDSPQEPTGGPQSGERTGEGDGPAYATKSELDELRDELKAVKAKLSVKRTKEASDDAEI